MVCSFSVHCVQCRREGVSVQLHAEQLKDRVEVIPAISLLHALPTPRPGYCNLGNGSAGQRWMEHYFQCIQRKHLSLKLQRILPYLGYLMQKIMVSGSWLLTGSCGTNLSLLRGKEEKMTSHRTITDTNTFVKGRNTQRFYKILSKHWSTLTKRNHLSTSLIRQGKKIYHLTANNTLKMSLLCVISLMSEGDKARYVHVFHTFSQIGC